MAFSDNFNRANEGLEASANWTRVGGTSGAAAVNSNKLNVTDTTSGGTAYRCPDIGTADHYVEARWLDNDRSSGPFICCRLTDNNNFIGVRFNGDSTSTHIEVYTRKAGTLSNLLNANSPINNGDVLRLEAEGNAWRVKVNGALRHSGTFTEGVLAGVTRCGIVSRVVSYTALGFIDDFAAGPLVAPPSGGSAPPRANCGVRI